MFQTAPIPPMSAGEVLASAEKRLSGMIARRGIDDEVLATAGTYERMYRDALGQAAPIDDTFALAEAVS